MTCENLFLDFETRSELDLTVVGLDNYARHPSTKVLMLAYAFDDEPVEVWEPHIDPEMPGRLSEGIDDITIAKIAWNAPFERTIFRDVLHNSLPLGYFEDPQLQARMLSMPGKLEEVCNILELPPEFCKDPLGEKLIDFFCLPAGWGGEPTLFGVSETWFRDWSTHPREWEQFRKYCLQDVVAEREIHRKLKKFPLPSIEYQGWHLDQEINERGLPVDMVLVRGAAAMAEWEKETLRKQLKELTGLENPNSRDQMLGWVQAHGFIFNSLAKPIVNRSLNGEGGLDADGRKALLLRAQLSKTADSKLEVLKNMVSADGRLRNQYVFLGAAKTGRWASYDVQLANLPRPTKEVEKRLNLAIELLKAEDKIGLELEFPNTLEVVGSCIRSMFRARPGHRFVIADLNAIENRMIGWLAGCDAILNVFQEGRDPYLDFAALLQCEDYTNQAEHKTAYTKLSAAYKAGDPKAKELRLQAKPAVLGCGYRLSGGEETTNEDGDVVRTGLWGYAVSMGVELTQKAAQVAVNIFRKKYKPVCDLWYALEVAAKAALQTGQPQVVRHVTFRAFGDRLLQIMLPSGRGIHYVRPKLEEIQFRGSDKETLTYDGIDGRTHKWVRLKTHGGKLLENISQAVSRDILLHGMQEATKAGFPIIAHLHDEIICETPLESLLGVEQLVQCMSASPEWAKDLPLGADGFESEVYRKA